MHPNKQLSRRRGGSAAGRLGTLVALMAAGALGSTAASAQELVHRFINPSFGGNPFYSEHLLGIAGIHRPDEPKEPGDPAPTQEELLAQQIQARLLSQLSSDILDRIEDAKPGDTGDFTFGNQRVTFTRTATETRVTFLNTTTNESQLVVIPVQGASAALAAAAGRTAASVSAEQALGAAGSSLAPSANYGLAPPPL
jgi:curli production assembly/transport component CsgF